MLKRNTNFEIGDQETKHKKNKISKSYKIPKLSKTSKNAHNTSKALKKSQFQTQRKPKVPQRFLEDSALPTSSKNGSETTKFNKESKKLLGDLKMKLNPESELNSPYTSNMHNKSASSKNVQKTPKISKAFKKSSSSASLLKNSSFSKKRKSPPTSTYISESSKTLKMLPETSKVSKTPTSGSKTSNKPIEAPRKEMTLKATAGKSEVGKYLCEVCDRIFAKKSALAVHSHVHNKNAYECGVCGHKFNSKSLLRKHEVVHSKEMLECSICSDGKLYKGRRGLGQHMIMHKMNKYECGKCMRKLGSYDDLLNHLESNHQ